MTSNNNTLLHDAHAVLHMNESWVPYSDVSADAVVPDMVPYVKSLSTFPTWITNTVFNISFAVGILTNSLLLAYLIYYKRYKSPVFCVILSLCVADLGVCISSLLLFSLVIPFVLGPLWLCNVTLAILYTSYVASSYHIAVFAVLRFTQLVYPLASHAKVTTGLMSKVCLMIWGINSIQVLVGAYNYEAVNISTIATAPVYVCLCIRFRVTVICVITFWLFVPFVTTSSFHVAKQAKVVLSRAANVTSRNERVQNVKRQTDSRALALTIMVYLVTISPYIIQSIRAFVFSVAENPIEAYLTTVFCQIAYSNSAMNPWIYLFAAESVRSDVRKMLTCNK